MPRKAHVAKRKVDPDPLYKSEAIAKFIHCLMYDGKKSVMNALFTRPWNKLERLNVAPMKCSKRPWKMLNP